MTSEKRITGNILNINPEPLGLFQFNEKEHFGYKNLIKNIISNAPVETRKKAKVAAVENIFNDKNQHLFRMNPELKELEKILGQMVLSYIKQIGFICNEVIITDAWLNVYEENGVLPWHMHMNSFVSGNYFINFDKKTHSNLQFWNDRMINREMVPTIGIPSDKNIQTIYNTKELEINANEGQVLIWRSHMRHGFFKKNENKGRITLSFNCMPKMCTDGERFSFVVEK